MAIQDGPSSLTLHLFRVVPLFPSTGWSRQQSLLLLQLNYSVLSRQLQPIAVILASLKLQSLSKDQLSYCQLQLSNPSPSHLNCIDLKILAESRGRHRRRRESGNAASCAPCTSICCHSSPCQLNPFEPTVG